MNVILKQAVPKLGKAGQVVKVKPGYARNFLFPQGMAILADKSQLKALERRNAKAAATLAETKASAEALKVRIDGKMVSIETKAGPDLRLFGAVTSQDVADAIAAQLGETVEKKAVLLLRPIKRLGRQHVELDVHRDVTIDILVRVFDPEHPEADVELAPKAVEKAEAVAEAVAESDAADVDDEPEA